MTIMEAVRSYKSGEMTFDQVREVVRQIKKRPFPHQSQGWMYEDDPDIEGTPIEVGAAAMTFDLTADEYQQLLLSLAGTPLGPPQPDGTAESADAQGSPARDPDLPGDGPITLAQLLAPLPDDTEGAEGMFDDASPAVEQQEEESEEEVEKHAVHDQSDHGNWADGGGAKTFHISDVRPDTNLRVGDTISQGGRDYKLIGQKDNRVFFFVTSDGGEIFASRRNDGGWLSQIRWEDRGRNRPRYEGDVTDAHADRPPLPLGVRKMLLDEFRKHYPGGESHDQERHGDWAGPGGGTSETAGVGTGTKEHPPGQEVQPAEPTGEAPTAPTPPEGRGLRAARPESVSDILGSDKVRERVGVMIDSAKSQGTPLDHLLFTGPPGLGKTTFARAIAHDMNGREPIIIQGSALDRETLTEILSKINEGDILFIDEIHAIPKGIQESLYSVMEDFEADMEIEGKTYRVQLPEFTMIGATTNPEGLAQPLRDRFGSIETLDYYEDDTLGQIASTTAAKLGFELPPDIAKAIAVRSRGTPRVANRYVRRVKDYSNATGQPITADLANKALDLWEADSAGLTKEDRRILSALAEYKAPVGVSTLSSYTGQSEATISGAIEPYLLRKGFIQKTPRGRIITEKGLAHLNTTTDFSKSDESFVTVSKRDDRRNMIFGWANVAWKPEGQVEDAQGHLIDLDDLEDAAYNYVVKFRGTGDMHSGDALGEMVESLVVTEDKVRDAGFPRSMLGHWWVGFKVPPEHWDKVEKGDRLMFSIQGRARLEPLDD